MPTAQPLRWGSARRRGPLAYVVAGLALYASALSGHALGREESRSDLRRLSAAVEVLRLEAATGVALAELGVDLRLDLEQLGVDVAESVDGAVAPLASPVELLAGRAHLYLPPGDDLGVVESARGPARGCGPRLPRPSRSGGAPGRVGP